MNALRKASEYLTYLRTLGRISDRHDLRTHRGAENDNHCPRPAA